MWKKINICIFAFVCEFLTWLCHLYLVSMVVIISFPPFIYLFSFVVLKLENLFIALIELRSQWISIFFNTYELEQLFMPSCQLENLLGIEVGLFCIFFFFFALFGLKGSFFLRRCMLVLRLHSNSKENFQPQAAA